jgi:hypothetical protein
MTDIEDALRRSGYLMEYRIEEILRNLHFNVEANKTYPDPFTQKPRELDLSATAVEPISSSYKHLIFASFLIECINNPYPMAFFTKDPIAPISHLYDILISGLPVRVHDKSRNQWPRLSEYLRMEKYHHYCQGRFATQYCSFSPKRGSTPVEWMASHDDAHFDSFNKLCFAVNYDMDQHFKDTTPVKGDNINLEIVYPIVVVSGEILDVQQTPSSLTIQQAEHVHFMQSYISRGKETGYHIDVVTESELPNLITTIRSEVQEMAKRIRRRKGIVLNSINEIAKKVKRATTLDQVREIVRP